MQSKFISGLKKKLNAMAKLKDCELIGEWTPAMVSHMHWLALSTPSGDKSVMLGKWISMTNHIINRHKNHHRTSDDCKNYKNCQHEPIPRDQQRKWFKKGKIFFLQNIV